MIGKKSKFKIHQEQENATSIQDQNNIQGKGKRVHKETEAGTGICDEDITVKRRDSIPEVKLVKLGSKKENKKITAQGESYEDDFEVPDPNEGLEIPVIQSPKRVEEPNKSNIILQHNHNLKSDTELLWDEICNGVKGKNSGIPMGFNRLNKYLGLRRSIYTTVGGSAGTGKTSLVDCAYVLNPYDWYIKNQHKSNVKFEVIYFSMERKKTYKLAKWLCMKIWKEEQILMTTDELLSWQNTLDKRKQELAKFYIDYYFKEMTESGIITIIDGQQNPTGIYKFLKDHAFKRGREEDVNPYEKRYIPDNDNLITNVIHDHAGKTKLENIGGKYDKKLSIDKVSEYYCWARDYLGYSPVMINQFNRTSYQDIQFSKKDGGDPDPTVEYWKDSGNVIEDVDIAISIFNPYKYNIEEYMGYQINDFTDSTGNNKFRGLKILKNSYGTDSVRIGLGFLGEVSLFKELSKSSGIDQREINSVINNDFFLNF